MACVDIVRICATCNQKYTVYFPTDTRKEADEKEAYLSKQEPICPACRFAREMAYNQKVNEPLDLILPEITSGTEKQITYAEHLRERYVAAHQDRILPFAALYQEMTKDEEKGATEKLSDREKQVIFQKAGCLTEYLCLTETRAWILINALRR